MVKNNNGLKKYSIKNSVIMTWEGNWAGVI